MKKLTVLFIQGAGEGAYEEDKKLAEYLQKALGREYNIIYPKMPNETEEDDELMKDKIDEELKKLEGKVFLVGHSAGGFNLLQYLSEKKLDKDVGGIFFVAVPFFGEDEGWQYDGITLDPNIASKLPHVPIFFYHGTDDEVVPFSHLAIFAKKIPQATIRKIAGRGHQLNNELSEIVQDIKSLPISEQ